MQKMFPGKKLRRLPDWLRNGLKLLATLGALLVFLLAALLVFASMTRYRPQSVEVFSLDSPADTLPVDRDISMLSWNIGYAGLGSDMDFFYDGGSRVRSSREKTLENLAAIKKYLSTRLGDDFWLLQEVDRRSKRSWKLDQLQELQRLKPGSDFFFALNYRSPFVPVPFYQPLGRVESGLLIAGGNSPFFAARYSYPGSYSWPGSLFNLQRCFLLLRYELENGRQLVVVNTHNSAFDDGGLRARQMAFLEEILLAEFELGNYVIAGGDWNQCPPGFSADFPGRVFDQEDLLFISPDLFPGWRWAFDAGQPTCRRLAASYVPGETPVTLIDFFLVSPNVEVLEVRTVDLDFANSDHNPVTGRFRLRRVSD